MLLRIISLSLALAIFVITPSVKQVQAQAAGAQSGPVMALLDIGAIRRDAASVKAIREQIINHQNKIQGEIQKEQEALRTAQQELAKKQNLLAPEAFAEERRKFEQRVVGMQQMVQQRRRAIEEAQNTAMQSVENTLNQVVTEVAQRKDIDVVFRLSQVVYVKTKFDITGEVLKELDQKMPTIKVDIPNN